jgi:hypothetical protein
MVVTPAIERAAEAVRALYEECPAGGHAHVVTDDMNVDNDDIDECIVWIDDPEADPIRQLGGDDIVTPDELALARAALVALQPLTRRQRVLAIQRGMSR